MFYGLFVYWVRENYFHTALLTFTNNQRKVLVGNHLFSSRFQMQIGQGHSCSIFWIKWWWPSVDYLLHISRERWSWITEWRKGVLANWPWSVFVRHWCPARSRQDHCDIVQRLRSYLTFQHFWILPNDKVVTLLPHCILHFSPEKPQFA